MSSRRSSRLILGTVLLFGLLLRVWPLTFPVDIHPDEEDTVARALQLGRDGLRPRLYKYPPFYYYLLFTTYAARYAGERLGGTVGSPREFAERFFSTPLPFYIQGRLLSALLSTLAIWLIYRLARALSFSRPASTTAALILAVSPVLVRISHFSLLYGAILLPVAASLLFAARAFRSGRRRDIFWAGSLAGIAAAVQYPAGVAFGGVLAAAGWHTDRKSAGRLLLWGIIGLGAGFLVVSPWALIDFRRFWWDIARMSDHMKLPWGGLESGRGYWPYLVSHLPAALGWPLYLAGLSGLVIWFRRDPWRAAIVAIPALVLWLVMGAGKAHFPRYTLPMLPALALGAAWWLHETAGKFRRKALVGCAAGILFLGPPLARSVTWDLRMSMTDTRSLASAWFERNAPPGARVLSEYYGLRLAYSPRRARSIAEAERKRDAKAGTKFSYFALHPPKGRPTYDFTVIPIYETTETTLVPFKPSSAWYHPERIVAEGIEWIALSSAIYNRYMPLKDLFPAKVSFNRWLERCWEEAARFGPIEPPPKRWLARRLGRPGPTIRIFRRNGTEREDCRPKSPRGAGKAR